MITILFLMLDILIYCAMCCIHNTYKGVIQYLLFHLCSGLFPGQKRGPFPRGEYIKTTEWPVHKSHFHVNDLKLVNKICSLKFTSLHANIRCKAAGFVILSKILIYVGSWGWHQQIGYAQISCPLHLAWQSITQHVRST